MSASDDPASVSHQETIEGLRQALTRIEAGETSSTLFQEDTPDDAAPASDQGASGHREAEPGERGADARPTGDDHDRARNIVLRKLTGSAKSRHQLAQTLRETEFSEEVITAVLDRLEEVHLIDDASFARMWVRTRHETRRLGRAALRRELIERGIAEGPLEEALEQLSTEDEDSAARELIDKKLRGVTLPGGHDAAARKEREKHTRRLVSMLARRGHSPGAAFQLVREALEQHTAGG